ncbi:MAG: DUF2309 domain-containing protein [Bacteroidia bacterium]|nr:DUF2309 domain-containing protein [Bacteroidia bacterium]
MKSIDNAEDSSVGQILSQIRHYLPTQNPLKYFIHHNTLHAFQDKNFHEALRVSAQNFGYQVYLPLEDYRKMYQKGQIQEAVLARCIKEAKGEQSLQEWQDKLLHHKYDETHHQYVGNLRAYWKKGCKINLDKYVHPTLFKVLGAFLDQGIANQKFPYYQLPFLEAIKKIEQHSYSSLFKTKRAKKLLLEEKDLLQALFDLIIGDEMLVERYLFDQQFAHPGWSGMFCVLEENPDTLVDKRIVSLQDLITFELLLELDTLDERYGEKWKPISAYLPADFKRDALSEFSYNELFEVFSLWQEAFEWSYYDGVLKGISITYKNNIQEEQHSFQAVFCIDDRECSFRRHLEATDSLCETFSTAGFFNVAFYFQPENGKFLTKSCPAPQSTPYLIQEQQAEKHHHKDTLIHNQTHSFWGGLLASPTIGFWSAIRLGINILFPSEIPEAVSSFKHMSQKSQLTIDYTGQRQHDLQVGFSVPEMVERVTGFLLGIGLVENFAPIVYIVGHGASSINNTHYAGYDCGACSGRAGSVNARVVAYMANKPEVRKLLTQKGIVIPETTQFIGALHDTTRDEVAFFDEEILTSVNERKHQENLRVFESSLQENAKERSRRFLLVDSKKSAKKVHQQVKQRAFSLYEPRPEWNHATNALCLIGKRENSKQLFLDRRAFLNSYDYRIDPDGSILLGILNAVTPVCGGINLEYYFSRVDNYRLGAGTKLPHNVMSLIGVANGIDGDLRTGLPRQMVDIHDSLRLLVIIEHFPDAALQIVKANPATYEWYINDWIHLAVIHPENKKVFVFRQGEFILHEPILNSIPQVNSLREVFETEAENLPVYQIY